MGENFKTFKFYLFENTNDSQIRRCSISENDFTELNTLEKLLHILQTCFSDVAQIETIYDLHWKDEDNDLIKIRTDEDVQHSLEHIRDSKIIKLFLKPSSDSIAAGSQNLDAIPKKKVHELIVCDGCEGPVRGYRFKCAECEDYDLCEDCFGKNIHGSHAMLRIVRPGQKISPCIGRFIRQCGASKMNCDADKSKPGDKSEDVWKTLFKQWGQTASHFMDQFGMDAMMDIDSTNFKTTMKNEAEKKDGSAETKSEESNKSQDSAQPSDESKSSAETTDAIKSCVHCLREMGFQEGDKLTELVKVANGNLTTVLDMIYDR